MPYKNQHKMLAKAISIAALAHVTQLDKGGKAYILHPLRILFRLRTDDAELMQVAALHDVVEDSDYTLQDLAQLGFSTRVVGALSLLTHDPGTPYEDYIAEVAVSNLATKVKLEDLRDNSDITRLKGVSPKDIARVEKYHKAYIYLKGVQDGTLEA